MSDRQCIDREEFDFHVDDLDADAEKCRDFFRHVSVSQDSFVPLAEHHTPDGASYYVLFDRSATYGHPGEPQYLAVHLRRDQQRSTFDFEHAPLPLVPMAQSWLIHRGCPSEAIPLTHEIGPRPADETTQALERRLVSDGHRFAMGYSYTDDDPDDMVTLVVLRALDERAPSPFRVLVEEVAADGDTYTLREGGFNRLEDAWQWCNERHSGTAAPLPPVRPEATADRPTGTTMTPTPSPPSRRR
ncbi:hypothetical protein [Streptomyces sp. NBRC 110465]|uniref:hypothetical protein n=1 Tax=Streptomyces sp. NBRC 110465 TaxID=1897621 RepID=UPI001F25BCBC|nr:hypothetical protein [Streptomyces sp. NBRC 110465]